MTLTPGTRTHRIPGSATLTRDQLAAALKTLPIIVTVDHLLPATDSRPQRAEGRAQGAHALADDIMAQAIDAGPALVAIERPSDQQVCWHLATCPAAALPEGGPPWPRWVINRADVSPGWQPCALCHPHQPAPTDPDPLTLLADTWRGLARDLETAAAAETPAAGIGLMAAADQLDKCADQLQIVAGVPGAPVYVIASISGDPWNAATPGQMITYLDAQSTPPDWHLAALNQVCLVAMIDGPAAEPYDNTPDLEAAAAAAGQPLATWRDVHGNRADSHLA